MRKTSFTIFIATPLRELRTPQNRPTPAKLTMNDREAHDMAIHILNTIQTDVRFFSELKLNGGLKSMTAKQYLRIVNFLGQKIIGKPIFEDGKGDPSQDIINLLRDLDYPMTLRKSMFHAPTAPHDYKSSIHLLSWMCDMMPPQSSTMETTSLRKIRPNARHPNAEHTMLFNRLAMDSFVAWNAGCEDVCKQIDEQLSDTRIAGRQLGNIKNKAQLIAKKTQMQAESEQLAKVSSHIQNEKKFEAIQAEFTQVDFEAMQLENDAAKMKDEKEALQLQWERRKRDDDTVKQSLMAIDEQIRMQHHNKAEFDRLKAAVHEQRIKVDAQKGAIAELNDNAGILKIQIARLLRDQANGMNKVNTYLPKLCALFKKEPFINFDIAQELVQLIEAEPRDLERISSVLEEFQPALDEMVEILQEGRSNMLIKLQSVKAKMTQKINQLQLLQQRLERMTAKKLELESLSKAEADEHAAKMKIRETRLAKSHDIARLLMKIIDRLVEVDAQLEKLNKRVVNVTVTALRTSREYRGRVTGVTGDLVEYLRTRERQVDRDQYLNEAIDLLTELQESFETDAAPVERALDGAITVIDEVEAELRNIHVPSFNNILNDPLMDDHSRRAQLMALQRGLDAKDRELQQRLKRHSNLLDELDEKVDAARQAKANGTDK